MTTKKAAIVVLIVAALAACDSATPSNIEKWKGTQRGPEKLTAVLLDGKYDASLRAKAAAALAEIEQWDKFDKALRALDPASRAAVVDALVPLLVTTIKEGNPPPAPPTVAQVAAKDALYIAQDYAAPGARMQAEDALVEYCTGDFNGRFFAGRYSIEVVLTRIGPRAAVGLAGLLKPGFIAYDKVAEIVFRLTKDEAADAAETKKLKAEARAVAAKNLLAIARERQGKVEEQLQVALGRMGGREVALFFLDMAVDAKAPAKVRIKAIMAYIQFKMCDRDDMDRLFKIAEDAGQDDGLRNQAYDAIACIKDKAVIPRIYALLHYQGRNKDMFRGVGVDEVLKIGGPEAIEGILAEIAAEKDPWTSFEDLRDFVFVRATQDETGKALEGEARGKLLEKVRALLASKDAFTRASAAFILGLVGEKEDAGRLGAIAKDPGKLKEWKSKEGEFWGPGGKKQTVQAMSFETVGSVAAWAVKEIGKREGAPAK